MEKVFAGDLQEKTEGVLKIDGMGLYLCDVLCRKLGTKLSLTSATGEEHYFTQFRFSFRGKDIEYFKIVILPLCNDIAAF